MTAHVLVTASNELGAIKLFKNLALVMCVYFSTTRIFLQT